jgi:hypothetical protein
MAVEFAWFLENDGWQLPWVPPGVEAGAVSAEFKYRAQAAVARGLDFDPGMRRRAVAAACLIGPDSESAAAGLAGLCWVRRAAWPGDPLAAGFLPRPGRDGPQGDKSGSAPCTQIS